MKDFVKRMVEEHSQLVVRINALDKVVYSDESDYFHNADFANLCIQLKAMRIYAEALEARLANQNVAFEDGQYFEKVAQLNTNSSSTTEKTNE